MKEKKDVLNYLKEKAGNLEIPDSILPERIQGRLEEYEKTKEAKRRAKEKKLTYLKYFLAAASVCLLAGLGFVQQKGFQSFFTQKNQHDVVAEAEREAEREAESEEKEPVAVAEEGFLQASMAYPEITYEKIYESMFGAAEEQKAGSRPVVGEAAESGTGRMETSEASQDKALSMGIIRAEMPDADRTMEATPKYEASDDSAYVKVSNMNGVKEMAVEESSAEYGTTNIQTPGVEEGDVVKNDGRFLYQKIYQEKNNVFTQSIQIVDTREKLTETARIEDFENIREFYVWEDTLVVIENKHMNIMQGATLEATKSAMCGVADLGRYSNDYHEISFYDIADRSIPTKIKTFTLKGSYDSSRIAEGYFYAFSKFYASPGEGSEDYQAYVPIIEGEPLNSSRILLPEENTGNCYLVLVSIDMKDPVKFTDTTAVVTDSDMYYVSSRNIFIADSIPPEEKEGWNSNRISLLRFYYEKGQFALQARGQVKGSLESSFSMDEYAGNLRMVTTVDEYKIESLKDDRTGEIMGKRVVENTRSNALYVLDDNLEVIGRIENLAKDEQIYSSRFMGQTGYFVTFRQTDPLFAVDLTDPHNPKIMSELKISGFSEYLHFYDEDRLLGIGMEADEETGRTEGMKMSMFDISDPADVKEIARLPLEQYYHSEALYNHRAVLISETANIIGFEAEGQLENSYKRDYLVYAYENEEFVQRLKLETENKYGYIYSTRGTFIGKVFYLLAGDGRVSSYDLNTGEKLDSLESNNQEKLDNPEGNNQEKQDSLESNNQ